MSKAKEFKKLEKDAEDSYDYRELADKVLESGDKEWGRKLYQKSLDLADCPADFLQLGRKVFENLADNEWVRNIIQQGLKITERPDETCYFGEDVAVNLGDKKWAKEIFKNALGKAEDGYEHSYVAMCVANESCLGDKKWAREIYELGLKKCNDEDEKDEIENSLRQL